MFWDTEEFDKYFFGVLKQRKSFVFVEIKFSNIVECQKSLFYCLYFSDMTFQYTEDFDMYSSFMF
jgi:hypothetical protein